MEELRPPTSEEIAQAALLSDQAYGRELARRARDAMNWAEIWNNYLAHRDAMLKAHGPDWRPFPMT